MAHAVLVKSTPTANATVQGPDLPITLKFNSRVDGTRSTLALVDPSGKSTPLMIDKQSAPDTITTHAGQLVPGKYAIHWQVLAVDGHITRGQILFEVTK
jgi:methionine-rich copper-binding protein CopC